jgi:hypothetical protein
VLEQPGEVPRRASVQHGAGAAVHPAREASRRGRRLHERRRRRVRVVQRRNDSRHGAKAEVEELLGRVPDDVVLDLAQHALALHRPSADQPCRQVLRPRTHAGRSGRRRRRRGRRLVRPRGAARRGRHLGVEGCAICVIIEFVFGFFELFFSARLVFIRAWWRKDRVGPSRHPMRRGVLFFVNIICSLEQVLAVCMTVCEL